MDRSQIVGIVLIAVMFIVYLQFFSESPKQTSSDEVTITDQADQPQPQSDLSTSVSTDTLQEVVSDSAQLLAFTQKFGTFAGAAAGESKDFHLENNLVKYTFSNKGALLKSAFLKRYKDSKKQPLYLMNDESATFKVDLPLGQLTIPIHELYFKTDTKPEMIVTDQAKRIVFTLKGNNGENLQFVYSLSPGSYLLEQEILLNGLPSKPALKLAWEQKLRNIEHDIEVSRQQTNINYYDGSFSDMSATDKDLQEEAINGTFTWINFKQRFFSSALLFGENIVPEGKLAMHYQESDSNYVKYTKAQLAFNADSLAKGTTLQWYFGPNDYQIMKKITPSFGRNVELGWGIFGWINRYFIIPIFQWLESYISNYGIIIMILVLVIKLILSPLSYKSYLSMAKMKILKPELDEIKEKYGDKMQDAQKAQFDLYRKVGVNPLSGCVPMLLQMPILFAMFKFFPNSIELRQQSFLWAHDLSTYDAIFYLPFDIPMYGQHVSLFTLLMTASTILYTWSNNQVSTAQGPMKSMTYIMPIAFMVFLNKFSAGLTFYYFVSNIVTFGQQALIRRFVNEDKLQVALEENKKRNANRKSSRFQQKMEEMMDKQKKKK